MSYGRFVGIAVSSEAPLSFLVLQKSGKVIVRKSIWGISDDELKHPAVIAGIAELDECIQRKLGDKVKDKEIDPLLTSLEPEFADDDPFDDAANLDNLDIVPTEQFADGSTDTFTMDDTVPEFDEQRFQKCNWSANYPGASEKIPTNAPEARGKCVTMTCYVDADHAGCLATRRSHTGVIILANKAPILWYSKRQSTVESSTFGSEFIDAKTAIDMI
jgi:hypothetical protein